MRIAIISRRNIAGEARLARYDLIIICWCFLFRGEENTEANVVALLYASTSVFVTQPPMFRFAASKLTPMAITFFPCF